MPIKRGDTVKFHYTGRLEDGTVFGSSVETEPLEFVVGEGQLIAGIEEGILGMEVSEQRKIPVPPEKGYGHRNEGLIRELPKEVLGDQEVSAGEVVMFQTPQGSTMQLIVTEVKEESFTVDGNHPLAGETLVFNVEIVEIS
jgi:peptidylprolyl isomerase